MSAQARVVERYTVNQEAGRLGCALELGAGHRDPAIGVRA